MASGAAVRAEAAGYPHTKTEICIYKTTDGKVIIEDELLNFIVVKMRTLPLDEIVLLVSNNFSSAWIEESKRVLFEMCPSSVRCVKHKGPQKDSNNIKDCLKVLNECGEKIPRFVSHNLDELPPVGFEHVDASALLSRVQQLSREVASLRVALETQTSEKVNERAAAAVMEHRVATLEKQRECAPPRGEANGIAGPAHGDGSVSLAEESTAPDRLRLEAVVPGEAVNATPQSPAAWSTVVKKGKHKRPNTAATLLPSVVQGRPKREQRRKNGVIGTGTESNIPVVKTKLVSVFATRFSPELDEDTLRAYLSEKLGRTVSCKKITATSNRFGSFHVTAECDEVAELYNAQLWPAGIYVRRYYESRKPRATGPVAQGVRGEADRSSLPGVTPVPAAHRATSEASA